MSLMNLPPKPSRKNPPLPKNSIKAPSLQTIDPPDDCRLLGEIKLFHSKEQVKKSFFAQPVKSHRSLRPTSAASTLSRKTSRESLRSLKKQEINGPLLKDGPEVTSSNWGLF